MGHAVCPWRLGYLLTSGLRRLARDPAAILRPYMAEGMVVFEPGPGMGFFTPELARRGSRAGGAYRRPAGAGSRGGVGDLKGRGDFVPAFGVVHDLPDRDRFFAEAAETLKPGGLLLLAEPSFHIPEREFEAA